jgi:hypothetical protein
MDRIHLPKVHHRLLFLQNEASPPEHERLLCNPMYPHDGKVRPSQHLIMMVAVLMSNTCHSQAVTSVHSSVSLRC